MAALLSGVGLYGVLSTVVRQRRPRSDVRMALGAAPGAIFQLVVGQGLRLAPGGILLGLAAAFALTRVMTSMLVGVQATDPLTFAAVAALFLAIAALACWIPARRARGWTRPRRYERSRSRDITEFLAAIPYLLGEPSHAMRIQQLGRLGRKFRLALGSMGMSDWYGPADEAESIATIHAAIDAGINLWIRRLLWHGP